MTIQVKATEEYFPVKREFSLVSCGTVYHAVQGGSNF